MTFTEAMDISKQIDHMADDLRSKLCEMVSRLPIKGQYLNDGKNGGPVIAIVKFSDLDDNWSPEYHLPMEQSRLINRYIGQFKTAEGICNAVRRLLETNRIPNVGDSSKYTQLNPRTLKTIVESELGQYVFNRIMEETLNDFISVFILTLDFI